MFASRFPDFSAPFDSPFDCLPNACLVQSKRTVLSRPPRRRDPASLFGV